MKQILLIVLVLLLGFAGYVFLTTPSTAPVVAFSRDAKWFELAGRAPSVAPVVYVIPRAAGVYRMARRHPIASAWIPAIERGQDARVLPFLLGGADVVAWREGRRTVLIADPDPLRRLIARAYLALFSDRKVELSDGLLFVGTDHGSAGSRRPMDARMEQIAEGLSGHAFILHRSGSKAAFPPLARPAVSSITFAPDQVKVESRSSAPATARAGLPIATYPAGAMLATAATASPEWIERLRRLMPADVTSLLHDGALYAIYRVDSGNLLPRLYGVIAVPGGSAAEVDAMLSKLTLGPFGAVEDRRTFRGVEIARRSGLGTVMEYATSGGQLLLSFDRSSIERYLADTHLRVPFPADRTIWYATMQPRQLAGAIEQLRERQELSLLAPDLHDAVGQAAGWLRYVRGASRLEMARIAGNSGESFILNVSK